MASHSEIVSRITAGAPALSSAAEAAFIAVHACMLHDGFRLASLAPDDPSPPLLPSGFRADNLAVDYRHVQSSMTFQLRGSVLGSRLVVNAVAVEDDARVVSFALKVADHAAIPDDGSSLDYAAVFKGLDTLSQRVRDEISLVLVPRFKDGREPAAEPVRPRPRRDPDPSAAVDPDPLRVGPPRMPARVGGRGGGFGVGAGDLFPPGLAPPGMGGMGGMGGPGAMGPGGGMFMGPDHPMFGGGLGGPGLRGPGGGFPGFPDNVPPGARYDPPGPRHIPDGGRPDPDHLQMPPGSNPPDHMYW